LRCECLPGEVWVPLTTFTDAGFVSGNSPVGTADDQGYIDAATDTMGDTP